MEVFGVQIVQGTSDIRAHLQGLLTYDLPGCEGQRILRAKAEMGGKRGARLRDAQGEERDTARIPGSVGQGQAVSEMGAEIDNRLLVAL